MLPPVSHRKTAAIRGTTADMLHRSMGRAPTCRQPGNAAVPRPVKPVCLCCAPAVDSADRPGGLP
jgi:hypothetical protein